MSKHSLGTHYPDIAVLGWIRTSYLLCTSVEEKLGHKVVVTLSKQTRGSKSGERDKLVKFEIGSNMTFEFINDQKDYPDLS